MSGSTMSGSTKPSDMDVRRDDRNETLDLELEQTFPASDPPSSIQPGTRAGGPDRDKKEEPSPERSPASS